MLFILFFFKQKTAYEVRISDWSSDVCSSDLFRAAPSPDFRRAIPYGGEAEPTGEDPAAAWPNGLPVYASFAGPQPGRASCQSPAPRGQGRASREWNWRK